MKRHFIIFSALFVALLASNGTVFAAQKQKHKAASKSIVKPKKVVDAGLAEARLIEVYKLLAQSQGRDALAKAENLVRDYPNFQLAQLVYGDLLSARVRPVHILGDVPPNLLKDAAPALAELRDESQMRLKALRERPPQGSVPSQFLALSPRNKHAIAIDASRSRLYLFENRATGLTLVADFYISVGKSGLEKNIEGDLRTPMGVYFITSNLDPKSLKNFYGSGALPLNYPNVLDSKRGKTGKGIWLHGTPPGQFSRPPQATDGCVVLANPDLDQIIRTVEVRTTPVVISQQLNWITQKVVRSESKAFEDALNAWQTAKSSGNVDRVLSFYSPDFNNNGQTLTEWTPTLRTELTKGRGRAIQLKDLSLLRWTDANDTMIVTFGEVAVGTVTGPTKRQYWGRQGSRWKIFFEGVIG
ncbi:MAG: L,D-transpeptidase family protein [Rhodoferax sp.]|uniref:L,D-transpeptidase family protein n=1 Tax=Rhodoferax sp. TaxID=50421 RepID=UPI003018A1CC